MTDDGSAQSTNVWPMPKFYFRVSWDRVDASFQEVSGLDAETEPLEYRAQGNRGISTVKMPGFRKSSNVTLKKGVLADGSSFFDWFSQIRMNVITRKDVTIALLDETGAPTMIWRLRNAFPVKVSGTDLKADGNEIAIESVELAHEGITIENG